jgi:hypothetical protein
MRRFLWTILACAAVACGETERPPAAPTVTSATSSAVAPRDALPAWNDGAAKRAVTAFVTRVTKVGGPDFVPPAERLAVFDNDGTLWAEKPVPVQLAFGLDRVKALAPAHPEWKTKQPFASVLANDLGGAARAGERGIVEMLAATQAGMTTDGRAGAVRDWIATARNPQTGRLYTEMVYEPMLELLAYLRANGFETYIVSGGGAAFMRVWTDRVYGIAPEHVVGSSVKLVYEVRGTRPVLVTTAQIDWFDDREAKPIAIQKWIGRRPIAAFGNSDGDRQMLEWTTAGDGPRFALLVHHDDAAREWAYDRDDRLARLDAAWDEAVAKGWTVVSMKRDWKTIYPSPRHD